MTRREWIALSATTAALGQSADSVKDRRLRLWYTKPAARWIDALPVGSGHVGAMVFGGCPRETIQINDQTLWSGRPHPQDGKVFREALPRVRQLLFAGKYDEANDLASKTLTGEWGKWFGANQTLGDLVFELPDGAVSDYVREVDLAAGIARVRYRQGSVTWEREVFAKAGEDAVIVRISASQPFSMSAHWERPNSPVIRPEGSNALWIEGDSGEGGVRYAALCRAETTGGTVTTEDNRISLRDARAVTLIVTPATTFRNRSLDRAKRPVNGAYQSLRAAHTKQHGAMFGRVSLDLGGWDKAALPTDERLTAVKAGGEDPQLAALYFQYGRYLLMSCSQPGGLPANLQGLWNHRVDPPWESDYHININIPMNYWPAELTNLSECHLPLFDFADSLREAGRRTAREFYGARGSVAHFTTNVWGYTEPGQALGYGLWQDALAWLCQHFWEHYRFTGDRDFLAKRAWPAMKEVAEFYFDFLTEDPQTGKLVPGPSSSPENAYKSASGKRGWIAMGNATQVQAIRELFENCVEASQILGQDAAFAAEAKQKLARLPEAIQSGKYGQAMEWPVDFDESEPGHRHVSHLYALHPGLRFDPKWTAAATKTLERRLANGSGQTGWSAGWMINFFARLQDGDRAHAILYKLLRQSTEFNLFDTHPYSGGPIFQIDGNLGGCAGIAEMLLQSHTGELHLLPALPRAWPSGRVDGLRARGGYTVSIAWEKGRLVHAGVRAGRASKVKVRAAGKLVEKEMKAGELLRIG